MFAPSKEYLYASYTYCLQNEKSCLFAVNFLRKESTFSVKKSTVPSSASQPFQYKNMLPYRTVLQYYSITVYHFGIAIEVYYIYNIFIIYIIKSFCNSQTKTVILYVRTLGFDIFKLILSPVITVIVIEK